MVATTMEAGARNANGRLATGHPGGPGRPKRAVGREYVRAISLACPPEVFYQIVLKQVERAKEGDLKAVEFLTRFLVGAKPESLSSIEAKEFRGKTVDHDVVDLAHDQRTAERFAKVERARKLLGVVAVEEASEISLGLFDSLLDKQLKQAMDSPKTEAR